MDDNLQKLESRRRSKSIKMSMDWEKMFRSSADHSCKSQSSENFGMTPTKKPIKYFCTGSSYDGQWNVLGMRGLGTYELFYDVSYEGSLRDNLFNGNGRFTYPNNARIDGVWYMGSMVSHRYYFADGMCYGPYCEMPDRRFYKEILSNIKPAGRSFLTNEDHSRTIPPGCYDTGDGFYNPNTRCVVDVKDHKKILRIPTKSQHEWIIKHCRKAWDEPAGYRPDLFENWEPERKQHTMQILDNCVCGDD